MSISIAVASADDTLAVTDALYRFGFALDRDNLALLDSVFDEHAAIDFGPCGRKLGLDFGSVAGRASIVDFLTAQHETQCTTHVVTNMRVELEGSVATLHALVDTTHLVRSDRARRLRMLNWYDAELVRADGPWRISWLTIDNAWFEGDSKILSTGAVRS